MNLSVNVLNHIRNKKSQGFRKGSQSHKTYMLLKNLGFIVKAEKDKK